MKKRLLALLLSVVMVVSMLPVQAFAADEGVPETQDTTAATEATVVPETTEETVPETTEETVPETTEETVPETTEETVPETTEETVPETTEETVPETTEETVPETTEETVPETTEETVPEITVETIPEELSVAEEPVTAVTILQPSVFEKRDGNLLRGGEKLTLTTSISNDKTLQDRVIVWEIVDENGYPTEEFDPIVKIDAKGVLTTYPVAEQQSFWVKATLKSTYDDEYPVFGILPITLTPATELVYLDPVWHWEGEGNDSETANTRTDVKQSGWMRMDDWVELYPSSYPANAIQAGDFKISGKAVEFVQDENGNILYGENGSVTVKPVRPGKATVTYTAADGTGCKFTADFTVSAPAFYVDVQPQTEVTQPLTPGDTLKMEATTYVYAEYDPETKTFDNFKYRAANQKVNWMVYQVIDDVWYSYPGASVNSKDELKITSVTKPTTLIVIAESKETGSLGTYRVNVAPGQEKTLALVGGEYVDGALYVWDGNVSSAYTDVGNRLSLVPAWYNVTDDEYEALNEADLAGVSYRSSKTKVAVYDKTERCVVTRSAGTATITASFGGQTASVEITADNPVREVEVTGARTVVGGKSVTLKATAWSGEYTNWIEQDGVWKPDMDSYVRGGKATNQIIYWLVTDDPASIPDSSFETLSSNYATINSKGKLTTENVDKKVTVYVVAVSDQGVWDYETEEIVPVYDVFPVTITPKQTLRTAVSYGGNSYDTTVYVPVNAGALPVYEKAEAALSVYDSAFDTEDFNGEFTISGDDFTWTSRNSEVAFINAGGNLEFTGTAGTTVLTVKGTAENGKTYTAKVTIKAVKAVTSITVEQKVEGQVLYAGKTLALKATTNADAANKKVKWEILDSGEASVTISSSGVVKAAKGITEQVEVFVCAVATDMGGNSQMSEPFALTIYPTTSVLNVEGVEESAEPTSDGESANRLPAAECVDRRTITLKVGEQFVATPFAYSVYGEATAGIVNWTTSKSKVVGIVKKTTTENWYGMPVTEARFEAKAPGTAIIKAAATDGSGKSVTFTIKVVEN